MRFARNGSRKGVCPGNQSRTRTVQAKKSKSEKGKSNQRREAAKKGKPGNLKRESKSKENLNLR